MLGWKDGRRTMIDAKRAEDIFNSTFDGFSIIKKVPFKGDYYFLAQSPDHDEFPTWFCVYSKTGKALDINPWTDIPDPLEFEKQVMK